MNSIEEKNRIVFLDWMRVIACFMVILVHSIEPFYLGGKGTYVESTTDAFWVCILGSMLRACVPMFVFISGYLLLPVKETMSDFYRKRFFRVVIPFFIWIVIYAVVPQPGQAFSWNTVVENLTRCAFNFPDGAGHLWFVYMLLGVYAIMPMVSPWLDKISKSTEEIFLVVWLFTTLFPFIRVLAESVFGTPELWGEANWNPFGAFYYLSGFFGYAVFGHYMRKWTGKNGPKNYLIIAIPFLFAGYIITLFWFQYFMPTVFPVDRSIELAVRMETSWQFCSLGTVLMTVGFVLIIRTINSSGKLYRSIILPISKISYGIYLMHIFLLNLFFPIVKKLVMGAFDSVASPVLIMIGTAIITFVACTLVVKLISLIPGSKYIIG